MAKARESVTPSQEPKRSVADTREATTLVMWSVILMLVAPVAGFLGGFSFGDPVAIAWFMVPFLLASFVCSVSAYVMGRRLAALGPAVGILALVVGVGFQVWRDAHRGNNGIPANVVALDVTYLDAGCSLPDGVQYAAGSHNVFFKSDGGATLTIRGPQPASVRVYSWTRPAESDGLGPPVQLQAGTYRVTCSRNGDSADTTLIVLP